MTIHNIQISVVLPVFNAANYLKETIDSILSQTFPEFELLIINDGSTDLSESIILSFDDSRIVYVKNNFNLGLIATLNKGIDLSRGKYIARMDADDICLPNRFEKQWRFMETHSGIDVLGTYILYFNKKGMIKKWTMPLEDVKIKTQLLLGPGFSHPTVFFRTSSLKNNQIYYSNEFIHAEDYELWVRLASLGFRFQNLDEVLLHYRIHDENVSKNHNNLQKLNHLKIQQRVFENFLNRPLLEREKDFFIEQNSLLLIDSYFQTAISLKNEMILKNKKENYYDSKLLIKVLQYFIYGKLNFSSLSIIILYRIGFYSPRDFIFFLKKFIFLKIKFVINNIK